jgi:hypothetical protein
LISLLPEGAQVAIPSRHKSRSPFAWSVKGQFRATMPRSGIVGWWLIAGTAPLLVG